MILMLIQKENTVDSPITGTQETRFFFWHKKKKNQRNSTLNVAPKPSTLISPNLVPATSSDPDDPGAAYPVNPISLLQQF